MLQNRHLKGYLEMSLKLDLAEDEGGEFQALSTLYLDRLNEFLNAIDEITAWIYLELKHKESDPEQKLNLNNLKLEDLVNISLAEVSKRYTSDD